MAKVDAWMVQRQEIAQELRQVAERMMSGESPFGAPAPKTDPAALRGGGWARDGGGAKKRTMSPEARAKIAEAQRARWAKQKAATPVAAKSPGLAKTAGPAKSAKKAKKRG